MGAVFARQRIGGAAVFRAQQSSGIGGSTLTSNWLALNNGAPHAAAPFAAFVRNPTTGALVLLRPGLVSRLAPDGVHYIVSFSDPAIVAGTVYDVRWKRTDTNQNGIEMLTAT